MYSLTGDAQHICRVVDPDGRIHRKKGGGWLCRRWTDRPMPRDLVNHTIEEWEEMLEQQAAREAKEEAAFQELLREVFGGMAGTEEGVMKDTTELLTRHKNEHDDKQAAMYKQWERHVFHNIQNQIARKLKKLTPDQISKKLRYQQMRYAKEAGNRKIFRDLINEHYDPFELEKAGVHYSTKKLLDPMKHDLEKEKREKVFFGEGVFHKVHTKDTLDPFYWTHDQFRSTMHGHINADDEDATYKPREMIPEKWHSRDVFWNGKWGSEYWNEAFPPGGKCMDVRRPPENYEKEWRIERDMVEWSPVKNYPKLRISVENPWF